MKKVKSIGLIETLGMVGAVEAADAAMKAANVELLGYELNRAGYVTVKLSGDVAAVKAAVSSGGATADRLGNLITTHVIARPDSQLVDVFVNSADNVPKAEEEKDDTVKPAPKSEREAAGAKGSTRPARKKAPAKTTKPAPKTSKPQPSVKPAASPDKLDGTEDK